MKTKKLKLPKEVLIAGRIVKIHPKKNAEMENGAFGYYKVKEDCIDVNMEASNDQIISTLLHEVLHAMWNGTFLRDKFSEEQEEHVVRTFEGQIFASLRHDPKLWKFLLEAK